jgi:adenylyltransferase/sulfurtransferase
MQIITAIELKHLLVTRRINLIDVRASHEFQKAHLPDAINIDFSDDDFEMKCKNLPQNKKIILYCNHGNRSELALMYLNSKICKNVYHLQGGLAEWEKCGFSL